MQRKVLFKRERKIVRAFAEVLLPLDPQGPEMGLLVDRIEDHLHHFTKGIRLAWRMCLWVFEVIAFFYYGKCRIMTRMDVRLRTRYINAWHHTWWSAKRLAKRFLETIVFMNYYSLPEVEKRLGYIPGFRIEAARATCPPCRRDRRASNERLTTDRGAPGFPETNLVKRFPEQDVQCEADVCVVGSGAGGALAAMALAEAGRGVVVLEEGGYFDVADFCEDSMTMTKKLYRSGGLINTFGWPAILVPEGRCVGGTTVINSGTCIRTPHKVFRWWVDRYGLATWSPEKMAPYFERVEALLGVEPAGEGVQAASGRIFARGAASLGVDVKPLLRNAPGCHGSGICCWGCPTDAKKSLQLNAVPKALAAGAKIYTRCRAERIVFQRHHATEVLGRFFDPVERIRGPRLAVKARAIIVACGTLHTPVLLAGSHIPNPSRQRGHNLTLHPASKVFALLEEEVRGWNGIPQGHYSDALVEEGIKLEGIFLPPAFTAAAVLLTGLRHRYVMERYNHLAAFGMMVSDTSTGRVLRGPGGHPVAIYNINREDLPKYQKGMTYLAQAFFAAGAAMVFPGIHTLPEVSRRDGAKAIAKLRLRNKDLDLQAFHPLGTCRMGADPREAVLDPAARVYGLDNLFVADGSIFPTSLGVNPQVTIMAAALKIADHIHREYL